jgi:uncharacterized membrane protein YbhN (UPF0104 family)
MSTSDSRDVPLIKKDITRPITFWILGAYVTLVLSFVTISLFQSDKDTRWFELAKTGFTTLGSSLTLILGYYFGKTQVAEQARKEGEKDLEKVKKEKVGLDRALKALETPSQPENRQAAPRVQRGAPRKDDEPAG